MHRKKNSLQKSLWFRLRGKRKILRFKFHDLVQKQCNNVWCTPKHYPVSASFTNSFYAFTLGGNILRSENYTNLAKSQNLNCYRNGQYEFSLTSCPFKGPHNQWVVRSDHKEWLKFVLFSSRSGLVSTVYTYSRKYIVILFYVWYSAVRHSSVGCGIRTVRTRCHILIYANTREEGVWT